MAERSGTNSLNSLTKTKSVDFSDEELDFTLKKGVINIEEKNDFLEKCFDEIESPTFKNIKTRSILSMVSSLMNRNNLEISSEEETKLETEGSSFVRRRELISVYNVANKFVEEILQKSCKIVQNKRFKKEEEAVDKARKYVLTAKVQTEDPSLFDLADKFIDSIFQEATRREENIHSLGIKRLQSYRTPDDFCVKDGMDIVAKFVSQWSFNPNWFYKTLYNGRMISESHTYFYIVRWSVPTPSYPVAQVTVDVNFIVDVIPMKPPPIFIEVWFRVETNRSQHSAFTTKFLETWIQAVVKHKLKSFQMFKF